MLVRLPQVSVFCFIQECPHKIGEVHDGETVTDWMEQEREEVLLLLLRLLPVSGLLLILPQLIKVKNTVLILLIPRVTLTYCGSEAFTSRLDGAVVVFDGVAGVEPQSETNWRYADEAMVPRICFINKLDRTGASFEHSFATILID